MPQTDDNPVRAFGTFTGELHEMARWFKASGVTRVDKPGQSAVTLYHLGVDPDFVPSYELKLKAGRNFSTAFKTDEKAVLINEKAAQLLGMTFRSLRYRIKKLGIE